MFENLPVHGSFCRTTALLLRVIFSLLQIRFPPFSQTYIAALENQLRVVKNGGVEPPRPPSSPTGVPGGAEDDEASPDGPAGEDAEGANAIRLLTKRNQALQAEVEEEKAEVKRRCGQEEFMEAFTFKSRSVLLSRFSRDPFEEYVPSGLGYLRGATLSEAQVKCASNCSVHR